VNPCARDLALTSRTALLQRIDFLNHPLVGPAAEGAIALERDGHFLLRRAFSIDELRRLRAEVLDVYQRVPADRRAGRTSEQNAAMFR
jgi:hypothetical protein